MHSGFRSSVDEQKGFTLIEVMIAGLVLAVGLMGLAYCYGVGLVVVMTAQEDTIARQKARETIESVVTALETQNLSFTSICNLPAPGCAFVSGFTPLYNSGADGIFGTADDTVAGVQTIDTPGPDGIIGTADDIFVPLNAYQRQVAITQLTGILTQVTVTIQFTTERGLTRTVTLTTYVSPYT
jgi:prepilin-type N-terminal cleavage/methylation domain-containing protein